MRPPTPEELARRLAEPERAEEAVRLELDLLARFLADAADAGRQGKSSKPAAIGHLLRKHFGHATFGREMRQALDQLFTHVYGFGFHARAAHEALSKAHESIPVCGRCRKEDANPGAHYGQLCIGCDLVVFGEQDDPHAGR
jgi:hypothetical protein